jgi:hypothetical protein
VQAKTAHLEFGMEDVENKNTLAIHSTSESTIKRLRRGAISNPGLTYSGDSRNIIEEFYRKSPTMAEQKASKYYPTEDEAQMKKV